MNHARVSDHGPGSATATETATAYAATWMCPSSGRGRGQGRKNLDALRLAEASADAGLCVLRGEGLTRKKTRWEIDAAGIVNEEESAKTWVNVLGTKLGVKVSGCGSKKVFARELARKTPEDASEPVAAR